jgi:hypothetical protein
METFNKMTNPVGRPRKIESPEKFDELVDSYIALCQQANEPILLTGLILSLGLTSKEGFYEYQNYEGFSDSVKRARMLVEMEYEKRLNNGSNAAAPIFALKNFGWADKQEIDHTSSDGSIKPTVIQLVAVDNDDNTDTTS